jgi:hypothetical protein
MVLAGKLPSQIYKLFWRDFYFTFRLQIKSAHYLYLKQTYGFYDEAIFYSGEMNNSFVPQ